MNEQDQARLTFVLNHKGWKKNFLKYMSEPPIPEINWVATEEGFVRSHKDDIDKTIRILEEKKIL